VHPVTLCLHATKSNKVHACVMLNGRELHESRATKTSGFGHSGSAVLRNSNECSRKREHSSSDRCFAVDPVHVALMFDGNVIDAPKARGSLIVASAHLATRRHILRDWNHRLHLCENLQTRKPRSRLCRFWSASPAATVKQTNARLKLMKS